MRGRAGGRVGRAGFRRLHGLAQRELLAAQQRGVVGGGRRVLLQLLALRMRLAHLYTCAVSCIVPINSAL